MNKHKGNSMLIVLVLLAILGFGGYMMYKNNMKAQEEKAATMQLEEAAKVVNPTMTITLTEQNTSGEMGTATLTEVDGKVVVTIETTGAVPAIAQPAHIHVGACPAVGAVKYPLTSLVDGKSVTTLDVTMDTLKAELPLGINVHKSAAEATVYVACGDLTATY